MIWKIYFWLYVLLTMSVVLFFGPWKSVDVILQITNLAAVIAAFGYLYHKKMLNQEIWRMVVFISIGFWLLYIVVLDKQYGGYPPEGVADYITGIIIPLPIYILATRYLTNLKPSPHKNKK